jgi:hypothetical protein
MQVTFKKSDFHGRVCVMGDWLSNGCFAFRKACVAPKLRPHIVSDDTMLAFFGSVELKYPDEKAFEQSCVPHAPYALTLKRTGLLWEKTGGLARLYMTASGPARGAWVNDRFITMLDNPDELVGQDELSPFAVVAGDVAVAVLMPTSTPYDARAVIFQAAQIPNMMTMREEEAVT